MRTERTHIGLRLLSSRILAVLNVERHRRRDEREEGKEGREGGKARSKLAGDWEGGRDVID